MDFIIVANDELAPLGRKLSHGLSVQHNHSGAFWTVKYYCDNEAQLGGKQPVIFLGTNEVVKSYVDVLPEHFRGFGTRCLYEGSKAVLIVDEDKKYVGQDDINNLRRDIESIQEELRHRAASVDTTDTDNETTLFDIVKIFLTPLPILIFLESRDDKRRKQNYRTLQHEYALSRFLKDEFETFVAGIEGR